MVAVDLDACSLASRCKNAALFCCKMAHDETDYAATLCIKYQARYSEKVPLYGVDLLELRESD